jgi:hypothetical protein
MTELENIDLKKSVVFRMVQIKIKQKSYGKGMMDTDGQLKQRSQQQRETAVAASDSESTVQQSPKR